MISLQKIPWVYILSPSPQLEIWSSTSCGTVPQKCWVWGSAPIPGCSSLFAWQLHSPDMNSAAVSMEWRETHAESSWDEPVQPRRLGRAGWVALWPQSPAQSVWQVTGFSQVTHLCPCHYPAVASCRNLRFSTPEVFLMGKPCCTVCLCFCFQSYFILCWQASAAQSQISVVWLH